MPVPTYTPGTAAAALASQSLAASGTVTFAVDASAAYEAILQVAATFGTIAATAGLQVEAFPRVGSVPDADTAAGAGSFTIAAVAGARKMSAHLAQGKYSIKLTNLDATNGLTLVFATVDLLA